MTGWIKVRKFTEKDIDFAREFSQSEFGLLYPREFYQTLIYSFPSGSLVADIPALDIPPEGEQIVSKKSLRRCQTAGFILTGIPPARIRGKDYTAEDFLYYRNYQRINDSCFSVADTEYQQNPDEILQEARVLIFGVKKEYRRRGIGTKLMNSLIRRLKRMKFELLRLEVKKNRLDNINFYKKFGFRETITIENYYDESVDGLVMELILSRRAKGKTG